jgi:pyrroloquinoline quinone biosynthesis protein B
MVESRPHAADHPGTRFRYGHLNNTDPAADADAARDGQELGDVR